MNRRQIYLLCTAFFSAAVIMTVSPEEAYGQGGFEEKKPLVVIDPGHGGNDSGAKGARGGLEKNFSFILAQLIYEKRGEHTDWDIILTRTADYSIDVESRVGKANYHNADLFLSIHMGSSFFQNAKGIQIYTYDSKLPDLITTDEIINTPEGPLPELWKNIQKKHTKESERFSIILEKSIRNSFTEKDVYRSSYPLLILNGADMPAAAVEFGYLTHPIEEKFYFEKKTLNRCADAIIDAIVLFFSKKS